MAGVLGKEEDMKLENPTLCSFCNHQLTEPKLLPCQHSFCLGCIKKNAERIGSSFACPECHLKVPLHENRVSELPEDFLYNTLKWSMLGDLNQMYCVTCDFEGKRTIGTLQCLDCGDVICVECSRGHTKSSQTRDHRVVDIKDIHNGMYKREIQETQKLMCPKHTKSSTIMYLNYVCETCDVLLCHSCVAQHQPIGHICKAIEEVHEEKIRKFKQKFCELSAVHEDGKRFTTLLAQATEKVKQEKESLEKEVLHTSTLLQSLVKKIEEDKIKEIKDHYQNELIYLRTRIGDTKDRIMRTTHLMCYSQEFIKFSTRQDFLRHEQELMPRIIECLHSSFDKNVVLSYIKLGDQDEDHARDAIKKAFGSIWIKKKRMLPSGKELLMHENSMEEPKILYNETTRVNRPFSLEVTDDDDIIAVGDSRLYAFNSNCTPRKSIKYPSVKNAWNIVVKNNQIYVSDMTEHDEKVIVIDTHGKVTRTIFLPKDGKSYGRLSLAVDNKDKIYISSKDMDAIYACEPGETMATLFLSSQKNLKGPIYLCCSDAEEIVVANFDTSYLQAYNELGELLWQYKCDDVMKLANPKGMCCDVEGNIYVADSACHKVHLIYQGEFRNSIKISHRFGPPFCITMDEESNLVIAHSNGTMLAKLQIWSS